MSSTSSSSSSSPSSYLDPLAPGASPANESPGEAAALWPAVASLSLGVFGLVTAEFLPASLLTDMAADLHVTAGGAGPGGPAPAPVGAGGAPPPPPLPAPLAPQGGGLPPPPPFFVAEEGAPPAPRP